MSQEWSLDVLGNWQTSSINFDGSKTGSPDPFEPVFDDETSSSTDEIESRTHNQANELTMRTLGSGITSEQRVYTYDDNGNRLSNAIASTNVGLHYIYDAWNRLVRVELRTNGGSPPPVVISRSEYNAAWWRVFHEADTDLPNDGLDEEYVMTYGAGWQLVQEEIDSSTDDARDRTMEYFWGLRGIDDIVYRRLTIDRDEDTTWETERYYHITDPLFSTVAVIDDSANLIERVTYDAYGKARHHPKWDADRDGDVDSTEYGLWTSSFPGPPTIGDSEYNADLDANRNGTYLPVDNTQIIGGMTAGLARGYVSSLDYSDNRVGYAGYLRVEEAQLYCVRFRHYDDDAGKWVQRDPIGYSGGYLQYAYATGQPLTQADHFGLEPVPLDDGSVPLTEDEKLLFDMLNNMKYGSRENAIYIWIMQHHPSWAKDYFGESDVGEFAGVIELLESILKNDSNMSCVLQCGILEMTDEDIDGLLYAIEQELGPVLAAHLRDELVKSGVGTLSGAHRLLVTLKFIQGDSKKYMYYAMKQLGIPAGDISKARNRILGRIRAKLNKALGVGARRLGGRVLGSWGSLAVVVVDVGNTAYKWKCCLEACADDGEYHYDEVPYIDLFK